MSTRTLIWIATIGLMALAGYKDNLAAMYVALAGGIIVFLLHTLEVKINRLLDHHGIMVWDSDIAKE
jgi:hypothetical protein